MFRRLLSRRFKKRPSASESPLTQLEMLRETLDDLPEILIPPGYGLRTYKAGDESAWCTIMEGNVGRNWTVETCREKLIDDLRFHPENLFFATCDGRPVASACAWRKTPDAETVGEVHMVAVLEAHRRRSLGHLVNAAVLHRLKALGFQQAHLLTDDWRLPAIKSYLTAGFRPQHTHGSHPERWKAVFEKLGISD